MDYEDYMLTVDGFRSKMQLMEGWHRRAAYINAQMQSSKDISMAFNSYWPYGDNKFHIDMSETIKRSRARTEEDAKKLVNLVQFDDALKKLRNNGGGPVNTSRG